MPGKKLENVKRFVGSPEDFEIIGTALEEDEERDTSQCLLCEHFISGIEGHYICKAFPNGIPDELVFNEHDHTKPYANDNGIQFEPLEKEN